MNTGFMCKVQIFQISMPFTKISSEADISGFAKFGPVIYTRYMVGVFYVHKPV